MFRQHRFHFHIDLLFGSIADGDRAHACSAGGGLNGQFHRTQVQSGVRRHAHRTRVAREPEFLADLIGGPTVYHKEPFHPVVTGRQRPPHILLEIQCYVRDDAEIPLVRERHLRNLAPVSPQLVRESDQSFHARESTTGVFDRQVHDTGCRMRVAARLERQTGIVQLHVVAQQPALYLDDDWNDKLKEHRSLETIYLGSPIAHRGDDRRAVIASPARGYRH